MDPGPDFRGGGADTADSRRRPPARVLVQFDLLPAGVLTDALVLGDGLGVGAKALDGHRLLVDHHAVLGQHDLVLLIAQVGSPERLVHVRVRDRLSLEAHLLAGDGDRDVLLLGDDVLAQPRTPPFDLLGADVQLLLRPGHGRVGVRPGRVVSGRASVVVDVPRPGVLRSGQAVVLPERFLLARADRTVDLHAWGVLHERLLVADAQSIAIPGGVLERDEGFGSPEESRIDARPEWTARVVIDVDLVHLADLVSVTVVGGGAHDGADLARLDHVASSRVGLKAGERDVTPAFPSPQWA